MPANWKNLDSVTASVDLKKIDKKIIKESLEDGAKLFLKLLGERIPIDTGEYKKSWKVLQREKNSIIVGTKLDELFFILEFGSTSHKIEGNPLLAFEVNGISVIVRSVNHPGTRPQKHFDPAVERFKKQFPGVVKKKIKKHWKIFQ